MAVDITSQNFEQEVKQADKPVIIDVHAPWCGPCQMMAPLFQELEKELGDTYKFVKLNVDEARDLSMQYGITSVPTFIFLKNGDVLAKETGYMSKDSLQERAKEVFGS